MPPPPVVETSVVHRSHDFHVYINQYELLCTLGEGMHGKVMLARNSENNERVAIKSLRRFDPRDRRLPRSTRPGAAPSPQQETESKIRREIAIMTKCSHKNLVRLLEVIDDQSSKKIYLVMENLDGGEVLWRNKEGNAPVLLLGQIQRIMRDVTLGLEYLHLQGIIHRDIKPANLLWTADRESVKICDFGVSHFSFATAQDGAAYDEYGLSKTAGSPAFFAPEVCNWNVDPDPSQIARVDPQPITHKIDIWALGVTFYCLLFGRPPWQGINEWAMFRSICTEDFPIPDTMSADRIPTGGHERRPEGRELGWAAVGILGGLLEKDQALRMTLAELKRTSFIQAGVSDPERWLMETSPESQSRVEVTEEETKDAIHKAWLSNMSFRSIGEKIRRSFPFSRSRSAVRPATSPLPQRENAVAGPSSEGASRTLSLVDRQLKKRFKIGGGSDGGSGSSPTSTPTPSSSPTAGPSRANTLPRKQQSPHRSRVTAQSRSDPASSSSISQHASPVHSAAAAAVSSKSRSLSSTTTATNATTIMTTTTSTTTSPTSPELTGFRSRMSALLRQQSAKVVNKVRRRTAAAAVPPTAPPMGVRTSAETLDVLRASTDTGTGGVLLNSAQRAASWTAGANVTSTSPAAATTSTAHTGGGDGTSSSIGTPTSPQHDDDDEYLSWEVDPTQSVVAFGAGGYVDRPATYQSWGAAAAGGGAVVARVAAEAASDSSGTTSTATPHAHGGSSRSGRGAGGSAQGVVQHTHSPLGRHRASPSAATARGAYADGSDDDDEHGDDDDEEEEEEEGDDDDRSSGVFDQEEYSSDEEDDVLELRTRRPSAILGASSPAPNSPSSPSSSSRR